MPVTTKQIFELRRLTSSGILECKKALEEADGDIEKAIVLIRKSGTKISQNRNQNGTTAGVSFTAVNEERNFAIIGSVSCETDFGANSSTVSDFINGICKYAIKNRCKSIDEIKIETTSAAEATVLIPANEALEQVVSAQIREKVVLNYDFIEGGAIFNYTHFNKRVSTLLKCDIPDIGNESICNLCSRMCIQLACNNFLAISKDDVDEKDIKKEMEIAEDKAKNAKDDNIRKRMLEGYMKAFFNEVVFIEQPFIDDNSILIKDLLLKNNIKIIDYKRLRTF